MPVMNYNFGIRKKKKKSFEKTSNNSISVGDGLGGMNTSYISPQSVFNSNNVFNKSVIPSNRTNNTKSVFGKGDNQSNDPFSGYQPPAVYNTSPIGETISHNSDQFQVSKNDDVIDMSDMSDYTKIMDSAKPEKLTNDVVRLMVNYTDNGTIINKRAARTVIFHPDTGLKKVDPFKDEFKIDLDKTELPEDRKLKSVNIADRKFELTEDQNRLLNENMFSFGDLIRPHEDTENLNMGLRCTSIEYEDVDAFRNSDVSKFLRNNFEVFKKEMLEAYGGTKVPESVVEYSNLLMLFLQNNAKENIAEYLKLFSLYGSVYTSCKESEEVDDTQIIKQLVHFTRLYFSAKEHKIDVDNKIRKMDDLIKTLQTVAKETVFLSSDFKNIIPVINSMVDRVNTLGGVDDAYKNAFRNIVAQINSLQNASNTTIENVNQINNSFSEVCDRLTDEMTQLSTEFGNLQNNYELQRNEFLKYANLLRTAVNKDDFDDIKNAMTFLSQSINNVRNGGFPDVQKKILMGLFETFVNKMTNYINNRYDLGRNYADQLYNSIISDMDNQFKDISDQVNDVIEQNAQFSDVLTNLQDEFNSNKVTVNEEVSRLGIDVDKLQETVNSIQSRVDELEERMNTVFDKLNIHDEKLNSIETSMDRMNRTMDNHTSIINSQSNEIRQLKLEINSLKNEISKTKSDFKKDNKQVNAKSDTASQIKKDTNSSLAQKSQMTGTVYKEMDQYRKEFFAITYEFVDDPLPSYSRKVRKHIEDIWNSIKNDRKDLAGFVVKKTKRDNLIFLLDFIRVVSRSVYTRDSKIRDTLQFITRADRLMASILATSSEDVSRFMIEINTLVLDFVRFLAGLESTSQTQKPIVKQPVSQRIMTIDDLRKNKNVQNSQNKVQVFTGSKYSLF